MDTGNTKGGNITVPLTSCLTGFDKSVLHIKTKIVSCHTADSKPVKQEVNGSVILLPLVLPSWIDGTTYFARTVSYMCNMVMKSITGVQGTWSANCYEAFFSVIEARWGLRACKWQ